jgi:capsular exopolysaccharide synthesis family protein
VKFPEHARLPALALAIAIAIAYALTAAWPTRYAATARVIMPPGVASGSQIIRIEGSADDPQLAARSVNEQLEVYLRRKGEILDAPVVMPQRPSLPLNLALGGAAGLALGAVLLAARRRRHRPVRTERELVSALGKPLLAARPLRPEGMRELVEPLLEHWFSAERHLLAIVGAQPGEGRSRFSAQLAVAFAELGHKTLLIDGDFRAPALHRAFRLPNSHGLADFLLDKRVSLASAGENLAVMVAGSAAADPLELLSRPRLQTLLAEARKHFRVVLIDTPAAARGPDFQMFAALAGGALVVTERARADAGALQELHAALQRCAAQLVTTVIQQG